MKEGSIFIKESNDIANEEYRGDVVIACQAVIIDVVRNLSPIGFGISYKLTLEYPIN